MRKRRGGIAFFDSGIGGLTVLAECRKLLPYEDFYYYGDNRHAPYGNLPVAKIKKYVYKIFRKFERWGVDGVVVACNTVTALCVEELRKKFSFPVVGAEPAVFSAGKVGGVAYVLSTRATYESARFHRLCALAERTYPNLRLVPYPCDRLAGAIEAALSAGKPIPDVRAHLPTGEPSAVVLGCTHYLFVKEQIADFYRCRVLDGNEGIARRLKSLLEERKDRRPPPAHLRPRGGFPSIKTHSCVGRKERDNDGGKDRGRLKKGSEVNEVPLKRKKSVKKSERTFFLGGQKKLNKRIYKQMFVSKVVFCGQKSQKN